MGAGRQVVDVAFQNPDDAGAVGRAGDVALAVSLLIGLEALEHDPAGDVGGDVLGGAFGQVLLGARRVELAEHLPGRDLGAVCHQEQRARRQVDRLLLGAPGELDLALAGGLLDHVTVSGAHLAGGDLEGHRAGKWRLHLRAPAAAGHRAAGVEGSHGQLRPRLADRLGGDDSYRLADVHQAVVGERPAVAELADPVLALALQRRAHPHLLDAGSADLLGQGAAHHLVLAGDHLAACRVDYVLGQCSYEDPLLELDYHLVAFGDRLHDDTAAGVAVQIAHDHVLGHVDQAAGQIAGVGCLQSRVHKPLSGAVAGDDVFGDVQSLAEIGLDRQVDDLPLRVGHETAHADQLAYLADVPSGAGKGHHVHRVQAIEVVHDRLGQLIGGRRPGVDHLVVALDFRDLPALVAALRFLDLLFGGRDHPFFGFGNVEVVDGDRHTGFGGIAEAQIFQGVGQVRRAGGAVLLVDVRQERPQLFLIHGGVDELYPVSLL